MTTKILRSLRTGVCESGKARFWRAMVLLGLTLSAASSTASHFLYIVDTSGSMKTHTTSLLELVSLDMGRALVGENRFYREGDQILLWSFSLEVDERLKLDFKPGSETDFRRQISSSLSRMKLGGRTSLTKPLMKALEQFGPENSSDLSIVLYTDGKDTVQKREADYIVRMVQFYYPPPARRFDLVVVRFGNKLLGQDVTSLVAEVGGRIISAGEPLELKPSTLVEVTNKPPQVRVQPVVSVKPKAIGLTNTLAPEILKIVPMEFNVEPPEPGLLVRLSLEATNLPSGMSITTTADRLATEGRQSLSLVITSAHAGHFSAKLKLSAPEPVHIEPAVIPVDLHILDILPSGPERIGLQFFSESDAAMDLPANGQWQRIQSAGLSLSYPDRLKETLVHFEAQAPSGVELQALAGAAPGKGIDLDQTVKLGTLGHVVGFQLRPTAAEVKGKSLTAKLSLRLQPGQNVQTDGTETFEIPFRFVAAAEVRIDTSEMALGQLLRGTRSVKRTLNLQVKGEATGKKLRLVKQGQGLAGISIAPSEIILSPGAMSVDLELSGLEDHAPGAIEGAFTLAPEPGAAVDLRGGPIVVRGTILNPGSVVAEIENPMVVGQPFYIRARLDPHHNGSFHAVVRPPGSTKDHEVTLADSGSAEDGDAQANDGIYSGVFKRTDALGTYQVWLVREGTKDGVQGPALNVPFFFKPQLEPLTGTLASRKPGGYRQFKSIITSTYSGAIAVHVEPAESRPPLETYTSTKSLEAGENTIDLLVGITPEAQPGEHKYKVYLVTDKIGERSARIPVLFEVTVVSFLQYFVKLLSITLAVAGLVFLAVIMPWKKLGWLTGSNKADNPPPPPPEEADQTLA